MLYITNTADRIKQEQLEKKVERLCKLYKCSKVDLLIMSIDAQAQNKKNKNNKGD